MRHEKPSWSYLLEDGRQACVLFTTKNHGDLSSAQDAEILAKRQRSIVDEKWTYLTQIHGKKALHVIQPGQYQDEQGDALYTNSSGVPISIQIADCAPIALICPSGSLGLVHAGWKGLMLGVVEETVNAMVRMGRKPTVAVLGPCIHPGSYAFGEVEMGKICKVFGESVRSKTSRGSLALDLPRAVELALKKNGVTELVTFDECTSDSKKFWSYRVRGDHQRQAVVGWIEPKENSSVSFH